MGALRPRRIGLFGGTFDPPHNGHLKVIERCLADLSLDQLDLVVANSPWQKVTQRSITEAGHRLLMVEAMAHICPSVHVNGAEIERGGPSYTVDTVEEMLENATIRGLLRPQIFVILGSDLVSGLTSWHRHRDLAALVTLAVVSRPQNPIRVPKGWDWVEVTGETPAVTSSLIRDLLARGTSVQNLVPEPVLHCIGSLGLYAVGR